jgi:hypothetical protein
VATRAALTVASALVHAKFAKFAKRREEQQPLFFLLLFFAPFAIVAPFA